MTDRLQVSLTPRLRSHSFPPMSGLPFELLLALRYLRPKRTFVSIITLISVVGVMLGVAVLIIVISVMSGFDRDLKEKVFGFNAHLKVLARGKTKPRNAGSVTAESNRVQISDNWENSAFALT